MWTMDCGISFQRARSPIGGSCAVVSSVIRETQGTQHPERRGGERDFDPQKRVNWGSGGGVLAGFTQDASRDLNTP